MPILRFQVQKMVKIEILQNRKFFSKNFGKNVSMGPNYSVWTHKKIFSWFGDLARDCCLMGSENGHIENNKI